MAPIIKQIGRGIYRVIKKYWLRCAILIFICSIVVISFLNYKYGKELTSLGQRYEHQRESIDNALARWPEHSRQRDTWRQPGLARAAIFSAYLDARPEVVLEEVFDAESRSIWALIRIIAILPVTYDNAPLTCYYRYNETLIREAPAIATHIIAPTENFGMANSAAFVLCEALTLEDGTTLPWQVSFAADPSTGPKKILDFVDVHYSDRTKTLDQNKFMAVCVPSLHHGFDKWTNLVEFVEFYRMMGVEHFTFYKTSVSKQVESVLDYYERKGLATVMKWRLPARYVYERNLRYNGIFASMNDCLYRNTMLSGYKYVVNVDLDEFIVPRKADNFGQMMNSLDPVLDSKDNAVFIFRNMFFYLMHDDDPLSQIPSDMPKLLLHTKTTRAVRVNPVYDRSKYIVRGQEVVELGNHRVWHIRKTSWVFRTVYKEIEVNPEVAASQHYRYCEVNELVCWLRATVRDRTAHRFTETLGYRVKEIITAKSTIMSHFKRPFINPTRVLPYNSSYDHRYYGYNGSRNYGYNRYVTPCYTSNGLPCNVSYAYSLPSYYRPRFSLH